MIRPRSILVFLFATLCIACSITPSLPVTREVLVQSRIYTTYVIEESPEEVVEALNKDGEAILAVKRVVRGKEYLMHLKLLATTAGLEVLEYDR